LETLNFGATTEDRFTLQGSDGKDYEFAYSGLVQVQDSTNQNQIGIAEGGYIRNVTPMPGLQSLNLSFFGGYGVAYSYGWDSGAYWKSEQLSNLWNKTTDTQTFYGTAPTYFRVEPMGATLSFTSVALVFSGIASAVPTFPASLDFTNVDGEIEVIRRADLTETEIVIPSQIDGYPVTTLRGCFSDCDQLTKVTLPETITTIGGSTFLRCSSLAEVNFPAALKSIGDDAFYGTKAFKGSLDCEKLPNLTTIGKTAFEGSGISSVHFSEALTSVGNNAFTNCFNLTDVAFPKIGGTHFKLPLGLFDHCTSLTTLILPDDILSIPAGFCYYDDKLTTFHCGTGVTYFGTSCFEGTALTSVPSVKAATYIGDLFFAHNVAITEAMWDRELVATSAFEGCTALRKVTSPEPITVVGPKAFFGCSSLTDFDISAVTDIYQQGFAGCTSLTELNFPASVEMLGPGAFAHDTALKTLTIAGRPSYSQAVCKDCPKLTAFHFYDGLEKIPDEFFSGCTSLTTVNVPKDLTTIGDSAFYGCQNLTSFYLSSKVVKIGSNAFRDSGLTDVIVPNSVTEIGSNAFGGTALKTIILGQAQTAIGEQQFANDTSLEKVVLSSKITAIGAQAFSGCTNLKEIEIPASCITIGKRSFEGTGITRLTLPDSMNNIDAEAFAGMSKLESINIPGTVTALNDSVFEGDSALFDVALPSQLYSIGKATFKGCAALTSLPFPSTLTGFGESAFEGTGLASIDSVPAAMTSLPKAAFKGSGLKTVKLPDTLFEIGESAFEGCAALTAVTLPSKLIRIDNNAFNNCSSLAGIDLPASITSVGVLAFGGTALTSLTFHSKVLTLGMSVIGDRDFGLVVFPEDATGIDLTPHTLDNPFPFTNLTGLVIPASMTSLPSYSMIHVDTLYWYGAYGTWQGNWIISINTFAYYSATATASTAEINYWHWENGLPVVCPKLSA
jgi:hypothetical protein